MKINWGKVKNYILKLIYPNHIKCIFCGDELNQNSKNDTCEKCLKILPFISNACDRCGEPIRVQDKGVCLNCKNKNYNFVKAMSVFAYTDKVLQAIHGFKYSGKKYLFKPFAKYLLEFFASKDIKVDFVVDVPMFETREKERGYNHAKLLAEEFCKLTNLPYVDCCVKIVENSSQTNLSFSERAENIKDSFAVKKEFIKSIKGKTALIIDDVFTTGATVNEVCKVLLKSGVKECYVLTLAHTVISK